MGRKPDPAKPHSGGGGASPRAVRRAQPSPVFLGTALFVLGFVSLFTGHIVTDADWSRIRSRWRAKQVRNNEPIDIWKSRYSNSYYGCSGRSANFRSGVPENSSTGYLLIATSGGLNQQRIGITDAVVVAWILNATLVVPELDHHSFWKDDSDFSEIFDVDWFISYLSKDVTVVKRIPYEVMTSMDKLPWTMRAPRKSMPEFYIDEVLPILMRRRVSKLPNQCIGLELVKYCFILIKYFC